jgi:hypothetical protein
VSYQKSINARLEQVTSRPKMLSSCPVVDCETYMLHSNRKVHYSESHPKLCIVRLDGDGNSLVLDRSKDPYGVSVDCPLCNDVSFKSNPSMQKHFDAFHKKIALDDIPKEALRLSVVKNCFPPSSTDEELEQCSLLERIGCSFNTKYRLIICLECQHAIDPSCLAEHVKVHSHNINTDDCNFLMQHYLPMSQKTFQSKQPDIHDAVLGVSVNPRGYWCGFEGCTRARGTKDSLRDHRKRAHHGMQTAQLTKTGPTQAVFGPGSRCTRVNPAACSQDLGLRVSAYLSTYPVLEFEPIDPDSEKELSPLFRKTKWHKYYLSLGEGPRPTTKQVYYKLSHFADHQGEQKDMKKLFRTYSDQLRVLVDDCTVIALKWINTKQ